MLDNKYGNFAKDFSIEILLIPDKKGNIELNRIFWKKDLLVSGKFKTVPNLLIYADLMLSGKDKNIEIAGKLYERNL